MSDVKVQGVMFLDEARRRGFTTYDGKACRNCGGVLRYVSNRGCVACNLEHKKSYAASAALKREAARQVRNDAAEAGEKQYTGSPCKKCNGTERYTVNGGCVACSKKQATTLDKAKRAKYHSTDSLVMWVNEPPAPSVAHLYKLIPFLASNPDGGNWSLRYTDAHHLAPSGMRLFTGRDVLERPQIMQTIRADYTLKGYRGGHFDIVPHIGEAMTQAIRLTNLARSK
ncbi:hypothetical protein Pondi_00016 [Escherichia phage Pondi]|nr:hypothetical protein Pondi_00016 [Escherichia phage Pondi]